MRGTIQRILEFMRSVHDWNKRRKWVTDQEQARIERAEIEAQRAAEREAARRYAQERRDNPTEEEIEAEMEKLRENNRAGANGLFGGSGGCGPSVSGLDTDRQPEMPDPLGGSSDDNDGPRVP